MTAVGEPVGASRDQALHSQVCVQGLPKSPPGGTGYERSLSACVLEDTLGKSVLPGVQVPSPRYHYSAEQSGRWLGQGTLRAFLGAAEASSHLRRRRRLAIVKGPHENDLPAAVALRHHRARCPASCAALPPPAAPRPQRALFPHNGRGAPPCPARPRGRQRPRAALIGLARLRREPRGREAGELGEGLGEEPPGALWEGRTRLGERDGKVIARGLENDLKTWTKIKGENHGVVIYKYCYYFIICFAFQLLLCADRRCLHHWSILCPLVQLAPLLSSAQGSAV